MTGALRSLVYSVIRAYPQERSDLHVNVAVIVGEHSTNLFLIERGNQVRMARMLVGHQAQYVREQLEKITAMQPDSVVDWLLDLHAASGTLVRTTMPAPMTAPTLLAASGLLYGQLFDVKAEETAK